MALRKALVVGGGIAGLCTAWALVKRGFAVDLFEQGPLPNPRSSSHDEHRIIRHVYGKMEWYAKLMPDAFRVWDALWQDLGERHYEPTGAVYFLRADDGWYEPSARSLDALGIGYRDIPLAEVPRRFPMIRPDGLQRVVETDGAGMLFPTRILTSLVVLLAKLGVRFVTGSLVTEIDPGAGTISLGSTKIAGDVVVVAAGAWADRLVPELRGVAVPSRQAVVYLAPPSGLAAAWAAAPVMLNRSAEGGTYCLPPRQGTRLKVGDHLFSRSGNPDDDRKAVDADVARLGDALREAYLDIDRYALLERKICYYTVTEDERFMVRPIGAKGFVTSACSGHGFKLAPLIAEGVAQAIAGERPVASLANWAAGLPLEAGELVS
jgi:sarcosine oxidase/sarcosine oxidase subunit beta